MKFVKELMGHSSIETTMIYTHVNDEQKKRTMATVNVPLNTIGEYKPYAGQASIGRCLHEICLERFNFWYNGSGYRMEMLLWICLIPE
ncbi:hypothetical protein [Paenibacillus sp. CF095]|uniref:hypothetical protein n=1 Tax=Paenibacillus sp. CF095 TaxID=1881033 RepID=UPI002108C60D|nr:hypothetical protein [Paenibacillus sp. CF095]